MRKNTPVICGLAGVTAILMFLPRPAPPTPDERRAMASAEAHLRKEGTWTEGKRLRAFAMKPATFERTGIASVDYALQRAWVVSITHPGGKVGSISTCILDKDFKVIHFTGGK